MVLNIPIYPAIMKAKFYDSKAREYEGGKYLMVMSSSQSQPMEEQIVVQNAPRMASLGFQNEVLQRVGMFYDASRNLVQRKKIPDVSNYKDFQLSEGGKCWDILIEVKKVGKEEAGSRK